MTRQTALVTGASRGIGYAIMMRLAADGFFVVGTATTDSGAESISLALQNAGLDEAGVGLRLNVIEQNSIDNLLNHIVSAHGAPTVVVNNAGIRRDNLLIRMKQEEWEEIIDTDLSSVFRVSKACLKGMMKARFGRIVTITSVVAATGNAGQVNYCAAKAGVIGFTKALAKEVGSRNITVNAVAPGFIDTDMTRELPDQRKEALLTAIPLNRLGEPKEVANAVSFLCSKDASYITGETIHVNGGLHMA